MSEKDFVDKMLDMATRQEMQEKKENLKGFWIIYGKTSDNPDHEYFVRRKEDGNLCIEKAFGFSDDQIDEQEEIFYDYHDALKAIKSLKDKTKEMGIMLDVLERDEDRVEVN